MIPGRASGHVVRMLAIAVFVACALLHGCSSATETSAPAKRRIVSIGGAVTETVFALGAGDEVVAVDTSSVYPDAVTALPKVGYQRTLSAEGILALSPDLVIASDEAGPATTIEQLRDAGVRVVSMPNAKTIDEAVARITKIGEAIGKPSAALADQVRRDAAVARNAITASGSRFVLVYARGAGTLMVAGSDTAGSAMVELAGGTNAVPAITGFKPLSAEVLIAAAPDVLVIPSRGLATLGGVDGLLALPGIAETPAGRARKIVAYDDLLLLGFGPRIATAIRELGTAIAL